MTGKIDCVCDTGLLMCEPLNGNGSVVTTHRRWQWLYFVSNSPAVLAPVM